MLLLLPELVPQCLRLNEQSPRVFALDAISMGTSSAIAVSFLLNAFSDVLHRCTTRSH